MRLPRLLLLSSLLLVPVFGAGCGDSSKGEREDVADTSTPDGDAVEGDASDAGEDGLADTTPDTSRPDTAVADTGPRDVFDPQPDAWATGWTRNVTGTNARVLAMRYLGSGQEAPGILALIQVDAGAAAMTNADGVNQPLDGAGARVVLANFNPTSGNLVASSSVKLAEGESVGHVTKAPNGFAFAIDQAGDTTHVVLAQLFAGVLRASYLAMVDDAGTARLSLPASGDLTRVSSGGAATALALQIDAPDGGVLHVAPVGTSVEVGIGALPPALPPEELPAADADATDPSDADTTDAPDATSATDAGDAGASDATEPGDADVTEPGDADVTEPGDTNDTTDSDVTEPEDPPEPTEITVLPVAASGVAFLTLAAPTADLTLPSAGSGLVLVPDVVADEVVETTLGPVVRATAIAPTTIRERELASGDHLLLIGALPDAVASDEPVLDPSVGVVLWHGSGPTLDIVQIASAGGGLVLAGSGSGPITFGEDTQELADTQPFVAYLGSSGGFVYTPSACDQLLSLSAGFQLRVMHFTCDLEGQGPALVLTLVGGDDGSGEIIPDLDLLMVPLAKDTTPAVLSGIVSFTVSDSRAYGGLFDFGEGPRVVLVREDGQFYDSGVLSVLAKSGDSDAPILFQTLRQGGGGGGGGSSALTNAVVFAVPRAEGPLIGRARLDLETFIR